MRVLVTGANGFVGRALCAEAAARGMHVRGSVRRSCELPANVASVVLGDINENTDWQSALVGCDVVVHLAARVHVMREFAKSPLEVFRQINVRGTEHLARSAVASGVKRLVYVSSIKVNGEETPSGQSFSEHGVPSQQDSYSISKWEAEQALHRVSRETGLEIVILRPPLVYGEGVKGNFIEIMQAIYQGMPLPLGSAGNKRDLVYVGNLVDALIACVTYPNAAGQMYLVCDGEPVSTPDLIRSLAKVLSRRALLFPFPIFMMKFFALIIGKSAAVDRLTQSLQIDDNKIRKELGWNPPFTLQQGLQRTADWYLKKRKEC